MEKKLKKGTLIVLIAFPLILLLVWLLYTNKISFNLLSKASSSPDYILCIDSASDTACNPLYGGADGIFRLFHDASVVLDLNNDGQIYIQIKEGTYVLDTSSLSSTADQDREWVKLLSTSKTVMIEGVGNVVFDGGSYLGGVYAKDSSNISITGITFKNILTSTNYCKSLTDSCPVGRGIVLDNSKVVFKNSFVTTANNGSAILYNNSSLTLDGSTLSNILGVGVTVKDASTLTVTNKSVVTSAKLSAVSLATNAKLVASSTAGNNNEISRTVVGTGDTGYTILAIDNSSINLSYTDVKSFGGGVMAKGASQLTFANTNFTSSQAKKDALISLNDTAKIVSMSKTSIIGGLYGISMSNGVSVTEISSSDFKNNITGILMSGGTTEATTTKISAIKSTRFLGNDQGIYMKNLGALNIGEGTEFNSNLVYGIYEYPDGNLKQVTIAKSTFINNVTAISTNLKTAGTTPDLIITDTKVSGAVNLVGIVVTGASYLSAKGCTFDVEKQSVSLNTTGLALITDSVFSNNVTGLSVSKVGVLSLYRNKFLRNTTYGVSVLASAEVNIKNNIFDGNATALYFTSNFKSLVANNVVANSTVSGITLTQNTSLIKDYNNVYYNNVAHVKAVGTGLQSVSGYNAYYPSTASLFTKFTPQITSIKADPKLDATTWKPLSTSSVVINAGNSDVAYNDTNNTRNDIGITGGPDSGIVPGDDDGGDDEAPEVLGYWKLNEIADNSCSDGSDACDSSGNVNNGTSTGTTVVTGLVGNARSYAGDSSYIEVKSSSTTGVGTAFTIESIIKTDSDVSTVTGGNKWIITWNGKPYFGLDSSGYLTFLSVDGNKYATSTALNDDKWHFVAMTFDSGTLKLYSDGIEVFSKTGVSIGETSAKTIRLGSWDGLIDEVVVFNYVVSATGIKDRYNAIFGNTKATCGDGTVSKGDGEYCDDGNTTNGDGCTNICTYEADLNKDGKVTIGGDYVPLYTALKQYLLNHTITDKTYDLNSDGAITINGDYILFLKAYKYYLKSLL